MADSIITTAVKPTLRKRLQIPELFAIFVSTLGLWSCATNPAVQNTHPDMSWAEAPATVEKNVRELDMFNGRTGERMSWQDLLYVFNDADVILVGEQHGHPVGLATADAMWEDLMDQSTTAALSMEFFERDEQVALDDFLNGVTDKAGFLKAAGRTRGNYPPGHRVLIEMCKDAGRDVIASNVPRRYAALVRSSGFEAVEGLTAEQKRLIVVPETVPMEGRYRDDFFEVMRPMMQAHGVGAPSDESTDKDADEDEPMSAEDLEARRQQEIDAQIADMFRAQFTKDATMADSILQAVYKGQRPVLQIVGQFHTDHDGGIAMVLRQQDPNLVVWSISVVDDWSQELRDEDLNRADCVIYVGPREEMME